MSIVAVGVHDIEEPCPFVVIDVCNHESATRESFVESCFLPVFYQVILIGVCLVVDNERFSLFVDCLH